jgi:hypothetical protein
MPDETRVVIADAWPALPYAAWKDTYATLHMWTQIAGKVRLALSPRVNHWWEVALYVNARGLTTSPIPYGTEIFEVQFDFIAHQLTIATSQGDLKTMVLEPRSVANFYGEFMGHLESLGIKVKMWAMPSEVPDPIPFAEDHIHASYDPEYAQRFSRVLVTLDSIFKEFRAGFIGKDSPVHFFWGSFDLCVTRFSGRRAPERAGADSVTREAYSHEVISAGFWPGGAEMDAAFYAYGAPEPAGFGDAPVKPAAAFYSREKNEFFLPYEAVRQSASPRDTVLSFMQSTYDAGATLGKWDRKNLERPPQVSRVSL